MKRIDKVVTDDGAEHANEAAARKHLDDAIEAIIGAVVDTMCHGGCILAKKRLQVYDILSNKLPYLAQARVLQLEHNAGIITNGEFNG